MNIFMVRYKVPPHRNKPENVWKKGGGNLMAYNIMQGKKWSRIGDARSHITLVCECSTTVKKSDFEIVVFEMIQKDVVEP